MPAEFEDTVFKMKPGEISRPFFTPQGIHIVKVLERKDILPFEDVKDEIIRRQTRRHGMDKGTESLVEKLKKSINTHRIKWEWMNCWQKGRLKRNFLLLVAENIRGKCLQILLLPILRGYNVS